ncbi:MAG TPA: hypothetical protein VGM11_13925 [Acidobacteriaceae bacterium]|jgi:hypothetical protein
MRLMRGCVVLAAALGMAAGVQADSRNTADYTLRLHIFRRSETTFYHHEWIDDAKGDGRANLFENGAAHGVDFSFDCGRKIRASFGYETYPARWKKPGKQLTVLFPEFGKSGSYFTCTINTDVKDFAYTEKNGHMGSTSVDDFKHWMVAHNYDPEHGRDVPNKTAPEPAAEDAPPSPASH